MFEGSFTVMVTPFKADGSLDESTLRSFVDWQIEQGTQGLIPLGSTGEFLSLTREERARVGGIVVEQARKRVPVLVGTAAEYTPEAVDLSREAERLGADGVMVVPPYYSAPTPDELFEHYRHIGEALSVPVMVYNNPFTSNVDLKADLVARLSRIDNVRYIKESSGDPHRTTRILDACGDRRVISAGTPCMPVPVQQVDEHRRRLVRQDPPQQQALFAIAQRPAGADALQVGVIDQHHGDRVGSVVERRGDPQDRLLGALPRTGTRIQRVHHQQRQEAERDQHARPPRRHGRRGGRALGARRRWRRIVQRFPGPRGRWRVSGCGLVPRRGWSEANTGVDPPARRDAVHVVPDRDAASSSVCDLSREPEPVAS